MKQELERKAVQTNIIGFHFINENFDSKPENSIEKIGSWETEHLPLFRMTSLYYEMIE